MSSAAGEILRYDHGANEFVPFDMPVVGTLDYLSLASPPDQAVFADVNLHDVGETMARAASQLPPESYVTLFGCSRALAHVAEETHTRLIIQTTLPPNPGEVPDVASWQDERVRRSIEAGCAGAVIDISRKDIAQRYPEHEFFARVA